MKKIKLLTKGKYILVDNEDFIYLSNFKWHLNSYGYVIRDSQKNGIRKRLLMHRIIMKAERGEIIDHVNRNKLDNRKSNLRICNYTINTYNRKKQKNNSSGYRGVFLCKRSNKWLAIIGFNHKSIYIGKHLNKRVAAKMYDLKAKELYGDLAITNF